MPPPANRQADSATCLELAQEAERYCRENQFAKGTVVGRRVELIIVAGAELLERAIEVSFVIFEKHLKIIFRWVP